MHPINKKHFGPSGLDVEFYNGTSAVSGHIVKQMGTHRFLCSDGSNEAVCVLAQTQEDADTITEGFCTIVHAGQNVRAIYSKVLVTIDGDRLAWGDDEAAPTVANAIPDQAASANDEFIFVIPADTFADTNGVETLTLSMADEAGFEFDAATATITSDDVGTARTVTFTITATDNSGLSVSDSFDLVIS